MLFPPVLDIPGADSHLTHADARPLFLSTAMAKGTAYDQVRQGDKKDFTKIANARLDSIRSQFTQSPRAGKLKNKVCIITGVGSLKGIGYVFVVLRALAALISVLYRRASALLFAHEG